MTIYYGEVHDYTRTLKFGSVRKNEVFGPIIRRELYFEEEKLDTFETIILTKEMYESAIRDKKITIDAITYKVTDVLKEYKNSQSIHTIKLKNISEGHPLNMNEDELFALNQTLRKEQDLLVKTRMQEREKSKEVSNTLKTPEGGILSPTTHSTISSHSSENSSLERENRKLKNKITLLRILAVGVPIVTFLIGLATQL